MNVLKTFIKLVGLVVLALSLSGCWATWAELKKERLLREELAQQLKDFKKQQREEEEKKARWRRAMTANLSALTARLTLTEKKIDKELKTLRELVKKGQGGVVEIFATLEALQKRFQKSLGQIEEIQKQLTDFAQKLPNQEKAFKELQERYEKLLQNQKALAEQAIPAKLFARGNKAFDKKDYKNAEKIFKKFVERFGSHPLADNALLFIAAIQSRRGNFNAAIITLSDLISKYPQGDKVPYALLRLGLYHYKLGRCRQGRAYFKRLTLYRRRNRSLARQARKLLRLSRRLCKRRRRSRRRRRRRRRRRYR